MSHSKLLRILLLYTSSKNALSVFRLLIQIQYNIRCPANVLQIWRIFEENPIVYKKFTK